MVKILAMITWFKLKRLENKLVFGEFGKHMKYRRLCLERNARTNAAKLQIAQKVIAGRGVNSLECWAHMIYWKEHDNRKV